MCDDSFASRQFSRERYLPFVLLSRCFAHLLPIAVAIGILGISGNVVAQTTQPARGSWVPPSQRQPQPSTQPAVVTKTTPTADLVSMSVSYSASRQPNGQNTYRLSFKNAASFEISDLVLVSLSEPLNGSHKELPRGTRPPLILRLPTVGVDIGQSIEVIENKTTRTPILYLAISGATLPEPLWVRVGPDCTPRDGFVDPAAKLFAMAEQVAAAGNKDSAKERYIRIVTDYPEFPAAKIAQAKLGWSDEQTSKFLPTINGTALAASAIAIAKENEQRRIAIDIALQKEREAEATRQRQSEAERARQAQANAEAARQNEIALRTKSPRQLVIDAAELCDRIGKDKDITSNHLDRWMKALDAGDFEMTRALNIVNDEALARLKASEPQLALMMKILSDVPEDLLRPTLDDVAMDTTLPTRITLQVNAIRDAMKEFWFAANKAR